MTEDLARPEYLRERAIRFFKPEDIIQIEEEEKGKFFQSREVKVPEIGVVWLSGQRELHPWNPQQRALVFNERGPVAVISHNIESAYPSHFNTDLSFDELLNDIPFTARLILPDGKSLTSQVNPKKNPIIFSHRQDYLAGTTHWYKEGQENPPGGFLLYAPADVRILSQWHFQFKKQIIPPPDASIFKVRR